jgi:hypothetical protein
MLSLFTSLPVWFRIFSGWVHRSQQDVIACLVEENRLFKQRLGDRRLHFTPSERRRLARCYDRFSAEADDDRYHQDFQITANGQRPLPASTNHGETLATSSTNFSSRPNAVI